MDVLSNSSVRERTESHQTVELSMVQFDLYDTLSLCVSAI